MPTGVYLRTSFHRQILSEGGRSKKLSPQHRAKIAIRMRIAMSGKKQSEELKIKRGIYRRGEEASHWKGGFSNKEYNRQWKRKNRDRNIFLNHQYRMRRRNAEGNLSYIGWLEIKEKYAYKCAVCQPTEQKTILNP